MVEWLGGRDVAIRGVGHETMGGDAMDGVGSLQNPTKVILRMCVRVSCDACDIWCVWFGYLSCIRVRRNIIIELFAKKRNLHAKLYMNIYTSYHFETHERSHFRDRTRVVCLR